MPKDLYYRVTVDAAGATYDLSADLGSLTLEQREGQASKLVVELSDPYKVFSYALQDGLDVEVELGVADDHSLVFRGRIYQVDAAFPESGLPTLSVLAYDALMAMGLRPRSRVFRDQTLSAVVESVAAPYFEMLDVDVEGDPGFGADGVRQQDETDLAFLLRLAAEFGCKLYVATDDDGDTFVFRGQRSIMQSEPDVALYHGRCDAEYRLLSFMPTSDLTRTELPRAASGIDYDTGELVAVSVSTLDELEEAEDEFLDENLSAFRARYPARADRLESVIGAAPGVRDALRRELGDNVRRAVATFTSEADLAQRQQNQFGAQRFGMRASGAAIGNHRLRAQHTADVLDVGGRFSGSWFLTLVRHSVTRAGFRTDFECTR